MAADIIIDRARETPDKIAVIHNGTPYSYAHFARWIGATRRFLAAQALPVDGVAAILTQNFLEAWVLLFALRSLGVSTVVAEDVRQLSQLGIRKLGCIVSTAEDVQRDREGAAADGPWRMIAIPADLRALSMVESAPDEVTGLPASLGAHIMMTSGTTGSYKKVARDAATEALALSLHAEINAIDADSLVYVVNFPLWTAGGYRWPLISWGVGATVVIHQLRDIHRPMLDLGLTHVFVTPRILEQIVAAAAGVSVRNDQTRLMVTGGAMSTSLLETAKRELTPRVYAALASTEALTVSVTPVEQPDDLLWHRIHPAREVQVVDDKHAPLKPGKPGLVRVRIIDGLSGYLDDPAGTRAFFRDGYFYPGDLGVMGDDGRLMLLGRASDVINVAGDKIATGSIERALQDRLHVDAVCIVSVPDARGADELYLVIQTARPVSVTEMKEAVKAELGVLQRLPVRALFMKRLPRNAMGKIERIKVRSMVAESMAKSGARQAPA